MCCRSYDNSSSMNDVDLVESSNSMYTFPPVSCPIPSTNASVALTIYRSPMIHDFIVVEEIDVETDDGHSSKQTTIRSHSVI